MRRLLLCLALLLPVDAWAAISFIGSAFNNGTNGGNVTITLPGGMAQNDLVVCAYSIGDNDDVDFNMAMVTTGYTEVADRFSNDTQDAHIGVYYKFMPATPDASAEVDGLGGADASVAAVCMVFRGVDTGSPMDVVATTQTGIDTFNPNPPSIDYVNAAPWTVIAGSSGTTTGGGSYTMPTGYVTNGVSTGADDTGGDATAGMGYDDTPAADPEDPGVMTHSGTDSTNFAWCAATLALRPSSIVVRRVMIVN